MADQRGEVAGQPHQILVDLGPFPGLAVSDLDSALTKQVRATLPSLEHRREDVFGQC